MVVRLVWEEPGLGFDSTRYGSTEAVMEATTVAICQLRGSHPYRLVNVAPPLASLPPSYRAAGAGAPHSGPLLLDPATGRVIAALREPPPLMQQLSCQQPREDYPASSEPPTAAAADTATAPAATASPRSPCSAPNSPAVAPPPDIRRHGGSGGGSNGCTSGKGSLRRRGSGRIRWMSER